MQWCLVDNRSSIRKKQREKFFLQRFINESKLDLQIDKCREEPDFIVRFNDRLIGIEITEIFIAHSQSGSVEKAQESISSNIVAKARALYKNAGGPALYVSIHFGIRQDLGRLNRDKTAKLISDFILEMNLPHEQAASWRSEDYESQLPDEISCIHALRVPDNDMEHWGVSGVGWFAPLKVSALQERVDDKAKRLQEYRKAVEENWLIIIADTMSPSAFFEAKSDFDAQAILSPFNRTFYYQFPNRVIELGNVTKS